MGFLTVKSHKIEYVILQPANHFENLPTIVMLHEGLGSVAMWKDFPQQVSDSTGCNVMVYSRYGHGNSDPKFDDRGIQHQHIEALEFLPEILDTLEIKSPILFGHSDGASIALIYTGGLNRDVAGLILMAPHVMVEDLTISSIEAARDAYNNGDLKQKLCKYHDNVDSAFYGWNNVWLHPEFINWNIEEYLPTITCPVLAIQGFDDEYGTMEQIEIIKRKVTNVDLLKLHTCGHSPHRDQPLHVLKAVQDFVSNTLGGLS